MRILGIDFTSAPGRRKNIAIAEGRLADGVLSIEQVRGFPSFEDFENALSLPGPWIAGIDFPFGQPRELIEALSWPREWTSYVAHVHGMGKAIFEKILAGYSEQQPPGHRRLRRDTDRLARSQSPMNLVNPPVGKMFFQGSPLICRCGASIVPCAPNDDNRVIVEAYPALAAEALAGTRHYKGGSTVEQETTRREARSSIAKGLTGKPCSARYGVTVCLGEETHAALVNDRTADLLDAVLCAVQAAWSFGQSRYGVPTKHDPLEGWIVDPALL